MITSPCQPFVSIQMLTLEIFRFLKGQARRATRPPVPRASKASMRRSCPSNVPPSHYALFTYPSRARRMLFMATILNQCDTCQVVIGACLTATRPSASELGVSHRLAVSHNYKTLRPCLTTTRPSPESRSCIYTFEKVFEWHAGPCALALV